ncbi:MAG: bifunctional hydroxymethylpyrimidine kinase/phosphomethylpyrimidine kinase [Alphaproteobacteria bacterium]|nr:bifunctional hydroxymethylpyrimidine kinase/phosphomethylpyrimidine kinase [Alphaproteobacteria bacterium]
MILILSSFVAASPVGGGAQLKALAALETEVVLVPTTLFGRHPGLGPPGGAAVAPEVFAGVLDGVAATGVLDRLTALITGYFASAAQIEPVAGLIDEVRRRSSECLVVVDPIMGDTGKGLYVGAEVARAQADLLTPRADLLAPNAWELQRLTGCVISDPASARAAAREAGRAVLVSSVPAGREIGVLWSDGEEAWLARHARVERPVHGAGDLLTALFTAALAEGASGPDALETAVSDVAAFVLGEAPAVTLEAL